MEVFNNILALSFWEKFANFHGMLAMTSLILFGAGIVLYFVAQKSERFVPWLKGVLLFLLIDLIILDIAGLLVYMPYRASGGQRTILKASESTRWLHSVVFEHKEFLAFAPPLIILAAFLVTNFLGEYFSTAKASRLRKSVIFSLVSALALVLLVAGEAVLVSKAAPVK